MTSKQIEIIVNSIDLSPNLKSKLIKSFMDLENELISTFQNGGNITTKEKTETLNPTDIVEVGDKEYYVEIANSPEKRKKGLSLISELKENEGMLFVFDEPSHSSFTMEDTDIPLDIVFIDEDKEVIEVKQGNPHDKNPIVCMEPYMYVLEVLMNSGIESQDMMDSEYFDENPETDNLKMLVLNSEGNVQMKLEGGERIISRIKTKQLIKAAIKAYRSDSDSDYKKVGRIILKELNALDDRPTEYVNK